MSVKSQVLSLLSEGKGSFVGGEEMARRLGCSRAAIWKAVTALREEGHQIEAVRTEGYRLLSLTPELTQEGIRLWLSHPEVTVKVYPTLASTNQTAKEAFVSSGAEHGSVFAALEQSAGRGRLGRDFYSPKGAGLYFSIVLRPSLVMDRAGLITTAAATAVYRTVRDVCGVELSIKWVNDLYLRGKKVAGILTEAVMDFESGHVDAAIVGVGLNLFPPPGGYPAWLEGKAGPVFEEKREDLDPGRLIAGIVNELFKLCQEEKVPEDYVERNLVPGKRILLLGDAPEEEEEALALSITSDGGLLVRGADGRERVLHHGMVRVLGEDTEKTKKEGKDANKKAVL